MYNTIRWILNSRKQTKNIPPRYHNNFKYTSSTSHRAASQARGSIALTMVIRNTLLQLSCIGTMLALVSGDTIPVRRAKSKSKKMMKKSHKDSMDSKHHITYQPKEPATPQHMNIFSMQGSKGKGTSSKGKGKGTYPVPTKGKGVEPVATKGMFGAGWTSNPTTSFRNFFSLTLTTHSLQEKVPSRGTHLRRETAKEKGRAKVSSILVSNDTRPEQSNSTAFY